jgi:hypothetical protein
MRNLEKQISDKGEMSHNVQNGLDVIASRQLIAGESFAL